MSAQRFSVLTLFVLLIVMLLTSIAPTAGTTASVEAARRPTRTPRPTSTPLPTATPVATPTPTPVPGPGVSGSWSLVESPNVAGRSNRLHALAVFGSADIWAVGEHRTSNGSNVQSLTMRWDGASWQIASSPNPDPNRNLLLGVAGAAPNDIWAVGISGGASGPNWRSLILHWDGANWVQTPAPDLGSPGTSELRGVSALASNDVWAVGAFSSPATNWFNQPLIVRWDGANWTQIPTPSFGTNAELNAVAAIAPNDVWAVGRVSESGYKTLILHWDGATWSRVPSPNLGTAGNALLGIAAIPGGEVWAVGTANNGNSSLTLRWNGAAWNLVPSPNGTVRPSVNRNTLSGVAGLAPNDVWAVGTQAYATVGGAGQPIYMGYTLILHWDGAAWSEVPGQALPGAAEDGEFRGVGVTADGGAWAVGTFYQPDVSVQAFQSLIQRYTP